MLTPLLLTALALAPVQGGLLGRALELLGDQPLAYDAPDDIARCTRLKDPQFLDRGRLDADFRHVGIDRLAGRKNPG